MTSLADAAYEMAVLTFYVDLPDTPRRASSYDKSVAHSRFERGVPLEIVEAGMLLGSLRRLIRPPGAAPLGRLRSLAYFAGIMDALQRQPLPAGYLDYLRRKARRIFPSTAVSQEGSAR